MKECPFHLEKDGKRYKCINKRDDYGFHVLVRVHSFWNGKFE